MTDIHDAAPFQALKIGDRVTRRQTVVLQTGLFGFSGNLREVYDDLDAAWIAELGERGIHVANVTDFLFWNRFIGLDHNGDEIDELTFDYELIELSPGDPPQVNQLAGFPWLIIGGAALATALFFGGVKLLDSATDFANSPNVQEITKTARTGLLVLLALALLFTLKP